MNTKQQLKLNKLSAINAKVKKIIKKKNHIVQFEFIRDGEVFAHSEFIPYSALLQDYSVQLNRTHRNAPGRDRAFIEMQIKRIN